MIKKTVVYLVVSGLFLSAGCQNHDSSYGYLMRHPEVLQQKASDCEINTADNCDMIEHALDAFHRLQNDQALQPSQFGQRIMRAQQQWVRLKKAYEMAKQEGDQNKIKLTRKAYRDQCHELQIYYAVMAQTMVD